jgi:hypothetical protein
MSPPRAAARPPRAAEADQPSSRVLGLRLKEMRERDSTMGHAYLLPNDGPR